MKSRRLVILGVAIVTIALAGYGGVKYMTTPKMVTSRPWPDANDLDLKDVGSVIDGFQLTAAAEKSQVQSGDPIWIYASLKNLSGKTVYVDVQGVPTKQFFLLVQDEQHKLVTFTKYMDSMKPQPYDSFNANSVYNDPLKQNEDIPFRVKASQLYEMTAPGKYFITLKYKDYLPGSSKLHYVVSNTVTIEVTDSAAVEMASRQIIKPSQKLKSKSKKHK